MSGHSKWKQIKYKKAATDQARGKLFAKLANAISISAREGMDPQFNPLLRSAIEKARQNNMPQANIERAIKRGGEKDSIESLLIEAYGPGGVGILIEAVTDNKNRTLSELRLILKTHGAKMAEPGSLVWSFEKDDSGYVPKFPIDISEDTKVILLSLVGAVDDHADVQDIYLAADISL